MRDTLLLLMLCPALLAGADARAGDLTPLSDDGLAAVSGGEGIAVNVQFLINAYLDTDTDTITPIACPAGVPDCRLALEFNDLPDAWLVLKDYYGAFSLNRVWLDANRTPSSHSAYYDASRFPGGFDPNNQPVVQLSYDHSDIGLDAAYYDDGNLFYEAGRITAEFGPTGYLDDNVSGSPLGIRISDSSDPGTASAQVRFDGRMQLYGF